MLRRIRPDQVRFGMHIHGFEGAWIRHPFWRSNFLVETEAQLRKLCEADVPAVIIDDERGAGPEDVPAAAAKTGGFILVGPAVNPRPPVRRPSAAPEPAPVTDDRTEATKVMRRSHKVVRRVFDSARLGKAIESEEVMAVVHDVSRSVARNPHALIGVTRLKSKDEYTYLHSVAVCALMVNFARELGLPEHEVRDLGLAGLLHDIGKMTIPDSILNKPGRLDEAEFAAIRAHPEQGCQLLAEGEGVPPVAMEICRHHHEKIDGTGYPNGLVGGELSLAVRMGAICDVYDALTSNRAYKEAWSPGEAVAAMAGWEGHFDAALLFRFMQSILVFPPGMLVRLRSNRLGVVLDNGRRASRLKVRAFFSTTDRAALRPETVTISQSFADDQVVSEEDPQVWGLTGWEAMRDAMMGLKSPADQRAA